MVVTTVAHYYYGHFSHHKAFQILQSTLFWTLIMNYAFSQNLVALMCQQLSRHQLKGINRIPPTLKDRSPKGNSKRAGATINAM